jgi:hypothetical protein
VPTASPSASATASPTPIPFTLQTIIDSILRRRNPGADLNGDGVTDAADAALRITLG